MLLQLVARAFSWSHIDRLAAVLAYCTVVALFLHKVVKRWPPGSIQCTMACLPVLLSNLMVPWLFDRKAELLTFVSICFLMVWLTQFKVRQCSMPTCVVCFPPASASQQRAVHAVQVAGLCLNRGSLCQSLDFMQFWAVLWLPITPQQVTQSASASFASQHCQNFPPCELLPDAWSIAGHADPLMAAAKDPSAPAMPRITSNARLEEAGGSRGQLLAGFLAKAAVLGVIVRLLTRFATPRLVTELLYGACHSCHMPSCMHCIRLHGCWTCAGAEERSVLSVYMTGSKRPSIAT
jgi:hypothetical protein